MGIKSLQDQGGEKSKVFVYCLTFTSGKCYVGVTGKPQHRLRQHQSRSDMGAEYALNNAWRKYGEPKMTILAETSDHAAAFLMEKHFIKTMKTKAPHGYNMTDGGEGVVGRTEESLKNQGRRWKKRYAEDAPFREKIKASAVKAGPKVSAANKRFYATPEGQELLKKRTNSAWRENIAAANKRPKTPEQKQAMRDATKAKWKDPEYRRKVNLARDAKQAALQASDPQWVAKRKEARSKSMKERWKDPAYLEKMMDRKPVVVPKESRQAGHVKTMKYWTPENRAIQAERTRSRYAKQKASSESSSQGE